MEKIIYLTKWDYVAIAFIFIIAITAYLATPYVLHQYSSF
jgi:hypothetical protein